jgi:hypothetical protein
MIKINAVSGNEFQINPPNNEPISIILIDYNISFIYFNFIIRINYSSSLSIKLSLLK